MAELPTLTPGPDYLRDVARLERRFPDVHGIVVRCFTREVLPHLAERPIVPSWVSAGNALGGGVFKKRVRPPGSGRRGGFRVDYHWRRDPPAVTLLRIWHKGDEDDLAPDEVRAALRKAGLL